MGGMFRYTRRTFARESVLWLIAALWCVPFYLLIVVSLKSNHQAITDPLGLPSPVKFGNFSAAWTGTDTGGIGAADSITLGRGLINSVVITAGSVLLLIALGSVAGYALARRTNRLGRGLYIIMVAGILLPVQLAIIPAYTVLRTFGLVGSYLGVILLDVGLLMPLTVFIYTGFIRALPLSYEEAAYVDGARAIRTYTRVVFPLLRPVTGTVAILAGLIIWNDFFTPLIFLTGTNNQTLPVLVYSFVGSFAASWNLIFAAVLVSVAPILIFFVLTQRHLIRGFSGGIKA